MQELVQSTNHTLMWSESNPLAQRTTYTLSIILTDFIDTIIALIHRITYILSLTETYSIDTKLSFTYTLSLSWQLTSTPLSSSHLELSKSPWWAAKNRGVLPPWNRRSCSNSTLWLRQLVLVMSHVGGNICWTGFRPDYQQEQDSTDIWSQKPSCSCGIYSLR